MTTIEELIDELSSTPRGQIFLINLYHTLDRKFLPTHKVRDVCYEFLTTLTAGGHPLPTNIELVDRLGSTCVAKGLWQEGQVPILERHLSKREFVLTRVTSYSGFFYSVLKRRNGMPPIPDMPEPIDLSSASSSEIDPSSVSEIRNTINSGKWRSLIAGDVRLDAHCIWLAPLSKLKNKTGSVAKKTRRIFIVI